MYFIWYIIIGILAGFIAGKVMRGGLPSAEKLRISGKRQRYSRMAGHGKECQLVCQGRKCGFFQKYSGKNSEWAVINSISVADF